jgi:glutathione S-transferase
MITVHHLNNSRSQRILWLLEELGLPYEIRKYQRDPKTMLAPPDWFAGNEMSAADIQMSFPLEAAASRAGLGPQYPRLTRFLQRIQARPAYARALERGGKYDYAR